MNETNPPATLPPVASFILTHRLSCALLMVLMMMAAMWLPALLQGLPVLAILAATLGLILHLLAPGLVALISFGGGVAFAMQVAAIAALGVSALAGFALLPGLIVLILYGLLPTLAAAGVMRRDGVRLSAQFLSAGIGLLLLAGLLAGAMMQNLGLHEFVAALIGPVFDGAQAQIPSSETGAVQMLEDARRMSITILPGIMALGLWFIWWGDILLARKVAMKYGFYHGDKADALGLRFGKAMAYVFALMLVLANIANGDVQYVALNAALLLAGLLSSQGIAVGHSWLRAKGLKFAISLMYAILFIWAVMIIPFLIIGLLDIWFNFRRNIPAVGG
jgi:hypothetical protein